MSAHAATAPPGFPTTEAEILAWLHAKDLDVLVDAMREFGFLTRERFAELSTLSPVGMRNALGGDGRMTSGKGLRLFLAMQREGWTPTPSKAT